MSPPQRPELYNRINSHTTYLYLSHDLNLFHRPQLFHNCHRHHASGPVSWKQFEWTARTFKPQDILVIELDTLKHPARWKLTNTDPLPAANNGQVVINNRELILGILDHRREGDEWLTTKKIGIAMANEGHEINERTIRSQLKGLMEAGVVTKRGTVDANTKEYRLLTPDERQAKQPGPRQTAGENPNGMSNGMVK